MARTVIVGDLHGCKSELLDLLDHVGFERTDRLISVGDVVVRGPSPRGTVDLLMALGALGVRGNHEDRLLRWKRPPEGKEPPRLGPTTRRTAEALRRRHFRWLREMPMWLDLPEHGVRVIHAGLAPGIAIERQHPRTLMYIRCVGSRGEPLEGRGRRLWAELYTGPPHVVFGHNAMDDPQVHAWATGIDTGVVYGGRLTAMVLRDGERPPPTRDRLDALVSVPARRVYFPRK